jgi:hypothetical protein
VSQSCQPAKSPNPSGSVYRFSHGQNKSCQHSFLMIQICFLLYSAIYSSTLKLAFKTSGLSLPVNYPFQYYTCKIILVLGN